MGRIYVTHCSNDKDENLCGSGRKVSVERLHQGIALHRFIDKCQTRNVKWAIFCDKHGICFPDNPICEWYDLSPKDISIDILRSMAQDFVSQLSDFDEIFFYGNHTSPHFSPAHARLLNFVDDVLFQTEKPPIHRITKFSQIEE